MKHTVRRILMLALIATMALAAQDFRARLTVTVRDPSGSAVPGAALELTNVSTGEVFAAKTADTGTYTYLFLIPGAYS